MRRDRATEVLISWLQKLLSRRKLITMQLIYGVWDLQCGGDFD